MVWDNLQETDWFVGILEGEGSFCNKTKRVCIHNTDLDIIKACELFLNKNSILFNTSISILKSNKRYYKIQISGVNCNNLFNVIVSKLECRREEYQQIIDSSTTLCGISISLSWLIGIWEAEGSFCISKNHEGRVTPVLEIVNTNSLIVKKIVLTIKELGLSWYSKDRFPEGKKPITQIRIQGIKRCLRFLQITNGLWKAKRNLQRSKIMFDYCHARLSRPINDIFNSFDEVFLNQMKQLNG